jgi:hypothetical protein
MSQITDSVSSIAQDLSEMAASLAQDVAVKAMAVGELGADIVDSSLKKLQDAGVVSKPKKRSKFPFLAILIIIIGGAVAFKVLKGRGSSSPAPSYPETGRLADSTGVSVG